MVLNIAFGEPTIAVDTHLFRVGNRTGLAPGKTPLEVELALERVIPDEFKRHAHHWLILHGRYICVARKPLCERCLINDLCRWPEKTVTPVTGRHVRRRGPMEDGRHRPLGPCDGMHGSISCRAGPDSRLCM